MFDTIRSAIDSGKQSRSGPAKRNGRAGPLSWVNKIFKCFKDISTELKSVTDALSIAKSAGSGYATTKDARAALVREAPSQGRPETRQMSQASSGSQQQGLVTALPAARHAISRQESMSQAHRTSIACDVAPPRPPSYHLPNHYRPNHIRPNLSCPQLRTKLIPISPISIPRPQPRTKLILIQPIMIDG